MISDLAPIDLLLQRAGRLFRHKRERPKQFNRAELWIIEPEINEDLPDFGVHKFVYDEHILLRTWLILNELRQIEIPKDVENLIEQVYDKKRDCFDEKYLSFWNDTKIEMDNKLKTKRAKAKTCQITDFDDEDLFENDNLNLDEDNPEVHKTFKALTRDDERQTVSVVILTQKESTTINFEDVSTQKKVEFLSKREVKISKLGLTQSIIADETLKPKSWKNSPILRHHRLLILDEKKEIIINNFKVSLSESLGIVIEKTGGKNG
jgi:CRISPR-associated endonuclease/helicase Cas3